MGRKAAVSDDELRQARAEGLNDTQIGKKFGIADSTVTNRIGKRPPEDVKAARLKAVEMMRERKAAKAEAEGKRYTVITESIVEEMYRLRKDGRSNPEIAELLEVDRKVVSKRIGPTPKDIINKRVAEGKRKAKEKRGEIVVETEPDPVVETESEPVETKPETKVITLPTAPAVKEEPEEKCDKTPQNPNKNVIIPQKSEIPKKWPPTIPTRLFDFAYIPSWSGTLAEIAEKASPESWCFLNPVVDSYNPDYQILETYLTRTFGEYAYRYNTTTAEESSKHFLIRSKFAVMHTGLYTPDLRDIYLYFVPNPVPHVKLKWSLAGVDVDTTNFLCKIHPLPKNTIYSQTRTMVFHPDKEIRVATEHIFGQETTAARIPESIRSAWNAPLLLEAAVDYSRREAVSNKTLAIPCYKSGAAYFLLPLWLTSRDKPDVYALIEDNGEYYVCGTVLTKEQAYFDARLCGKVTQKWLRDLVEG